MIPETVTLIVKAPNQQIDDQNIQCQSSWTVKQLKGHLSEVYPSKPTTNEQKIIYSGQLLDDNIVLKDVLRTYESCETHTVHLVCTPKRRMAEPQTMPTSTDGLRLRNVTNETQERPVEPARQETRQNDQNHTVEMQNFLSSFVNNYGRVPPYPNLGEGYLPVPSDPAALANHMMMMQQAYLQYMQQYANMWQAPNTTAPPTEPPPPTPEVPAPPEEEDPMAARDWLDHMYSACRLAILFSLIYLYGSPARLLLVFLLTVAGYLHQIGFFRDLNVNPQANVNEPAPRRNEAPNAAQPEPQPNQPPNPPPTPEHNQPQPTPASEANDNQQSLLAVTWMIFTSFFSSLIPENN